MYTQKTGQTIRFHYSGSACLMPQAKLTEMGDLFFPAEKFYMDQALDRDLIFEWQAVAAFTPVIAVRKGNPKHVRTLQDLTRADLDVGLADPEAAAVGKTAKALLESRGLWKSVKPRVKTYTATVNELGNALKIGSLDVGIIWDAVASWYPEDVEMIEIPDARPWRAAICMGILRQTTQLEQSKVFYHLVKSPEGQAVFKRFGFGAPPLEYATPMHPRKRKFP